MRPRVDHPVLGQYGNQRADFGLRHRLKVMQVSRTISQQPVLLAQKDLGGDSADGGGNWCDGHRRQVADG